MLYSSKHIIDTVVLLYFLLTEETDLLCTLLGRPLRVPLAVYDPDDRTLPSTALRRTHLLSEMRQSIRHYENAAALSDSAHSAAVSVGHADKLYDQGILVPVEMTPDERLLAARLQSSEATGYGLYVPLGAGEAACISIAYHRKWTIVTDDNDALTALGRLYGNRAYSYERIRKLLIRAVRQGHITPQDANRIHQDMRDQGFWDTGLLLP